MKPEMDRGSSTTPRPREHLLLGSEAGPAPQPPCGGQDRIGVGGHPGWHSRGGARCPVSRDSQKEKVAQCKANCGLWEDETGPFMCLEPRADKAWP